MVNQYKYLESFLFHRRVVIKQPSVYTKKSCALFNTPLYDTSHDLKTLYEIQNIKSELKVAYEEVE